MSDIDPKKAAGEAADAIKGLGNKAEGLAKGLSDKAKGATGGVGDAAADRAKGLAGKAKGAAGDISGTAKGLGGSAGRGVSDLGGGRGGGMGRLLWIGLAVLGAVLLFGLILSQCGGSDETSSGNEDTASPSTEDDTTAAEETTEDTAAAEETTEDTAAAEETTEDTSPDLATLSNDKLTALGIAGLAASVDGETITLTGEVDSEETKASVVSAFDELDATVDASGLTVAAADDAAADDAAADDAAADDAAADDDEEAPTASATDSDPDYTG